MWNDLMTRRIDPLRGNYMTSSFRLNWSSVANDDPSMIPPTLWYHFMRMVAPMAKVDVSSAQRCRGNCGLIVGSTLDASSRNKVLLDDWYCYRWIHLWQKWRRQHVTITLQRAQHIPFRCYESGNSGQSSWQLMRLSLDLMSLSTFLNPSSLINNKLLTNEMNRAFLFQFIFVWVLIFNPNVQLIESIWWGSDAMRWH